MRLKKLLSAALLAFIVFSLGFLVGRESAPIGAGSAEQESAPASSSHQPEGLQVLATYFHKTQRCEKCLAIERLAHQTLQEHFPDELASGALRWRVINYEDPGNEHFVEDFDLVTSSLVLERREYEWYRHDALWGKVGEPTEFSEYLTAEVEAYLGGDDE